jgi:hypothetical protein
MATSQDFLKLIFSFNEDELKKFISMLKESDNAAAELQKRMQKMGDESQEPLDKMAKGFDTVVKGVKAFLALQLVQEISRIAIEASKLAAAGEGIRSAFASMGGSQQDLKKLNDAIGGTISNLKLMAFATKAMQKGLNMDQITQTLIFLDKQANATGKSFEELADKAIKNMKDVPSFMADVEKKTRELGKTASETGDAYGRLAASQENLQEAFGNLVNSHGFKTFTSWLAGGVNNIAEVLNEGMDPLTNRITSLQNLLSNQSRVQWEQLNQNQIEATKAMYASAQSELDKLLQVAGERQLKQSNAQSRVKLGQDIEMWEEKLAAQKELDEKFAADQRKLEAKKAEEAKKKADELDQDRRKREIEYNDFLLRLNEQLLIDISVQQSEAMDIVKQQQEQEKADKQFELTGAAEIAESVLEGVQPEKSDKDVQKLVDGLVKGSKEAKVNFEDAALSVFSLVDAMTSMGDENSSSGKKFFAIIQGMLGLVSLIPGIGTGVGIASAGIGVLGKLTMKNEGGWIPGRGPDRDSVITALTPGEFVTRRRAAERSPLLLEAINVGTIDDSFLKQLKVAPAIVNIDQDKVVRAIESMPQFDFYKSGSALFEVKRIASEKRIQRKQRMTL